MKAAEQIIAQIEAAGLGMGDREGRPYAGLVAELFRAVGATLVVAHAGFPMALFGSVRDAARAWDATSHVRNEAVPDSGWATARVAPTRLGNLVGMRRSLAG